MNAPRARIIRAPVEPGAARGEPLFTLDPGPRARRRIAREELEARSAAERILCDARAQADAVVAAAREQAAVAAEQRMREAAEEAEAKIAAQALILRAEEATRLERQRERILAIAVVLAERLLGAALELDPQRIVEMARAAIDEARGARRVILEAHPLDAEVLKEHLGAAGLGERAVEVRAEQALARGELRLQTDIGTIDAKLSPRLERLAAALRDALP